MATVLKSEIRIGLPVSVFRYDQQGEADEHVDTGIITAYSNMHNEFAEIEVECTVPFAEGSKVGQKNWYGFYTHLFIHHRPEAV